MAGSNSYASLVANFGEFLVVAIHTILYERNIYSQSSFDASKKYNYPVRQCRHPKVWSWILDAVSAVQKQLLLGTVDRIAIVIYSPLSQPLERFVFDVSKFPIVPREDHYTPMERDATDQAKPPSVDLEEQFRAAMSRLTNCNTVLAPVPSGCSFNVAIELKDEADPPIGHPQPWIPVQPSLQKQVSRSDSDELSGSLGEDLGGVKTVPVRAVETGEMVFEVWIEEGRGKADAMPSQTSTQVTD